MVRRVLERVLRLFGRKKEEKSQQDTDDWKERVAEARSRGECPEEQALEMAKRGAEFDTREGLGEIEVVTHPNQEEGDARVE